MRFIGPMLFLLACGSSTAVESSPRPQTPSPEPVAEADAPVQDPRDAVCRPDGWCQLNAFPEDGSSAIWARSRNDVYVVGAAGAISHFDGEHWSAMESGTSANLTAIWGTSSGQVFVVGYSGAVARFDGSSWHADEPVTTKTLHDVWGTADDDVYAVGVDGTIVHWDGERWATQDSGTEESLSSVWARRAGEVYAGGRRGVLLKNDGTGWSATPSPVSEQSIRSLYGTDRELLAGMDGRLWRRPWGETSWEELTDDHVWLDDIGGDSLDGLVGISMSALRRHGATEWERVGSFGCRHLWAPTNDELFCAGSDVHYLGPDGHEVLSRGSRGELRAVWGTDDSHVIAVGSGGLALHFDGLRWEEVETNTRSYLYDVWGTDWNHAWATGNDGQIFFWDGETWSPQPTDEPTEYLSALWGSGARDVWAVGDEGAIQHFDGERWEPVESNTTRTLVGVWGRNAREVYAFGDGSLVIRWDGERWSNVPIADERMSLRELGEAEFVFAKTNRAALAFDGEHWRWVSSLGARSYLRLGATSAFSVDYRHGIRRFDGSSWATVAAPKPKVRDFWAASPTSVYAVGEHGSILHWDGRELSHRADVVTLRSIDHEAVQRRHAFARHLREGRRLSGRRHYARAQREFARAVELEPENGTALCEHGWAAFRAGDRSSAGESLRKGARAARVPSTRGACLYNLGRLEEREGRRGVAIEHYLESLRVRPNATVRARLAALGAAPRPGSNDWEARCGSPETLSGPRELCDHMDDLMGEVGDDDQRCTETAPFALEGLGQLLWVNSDGMHVNAGMLVHQQGDSFREIGVMAVSESWNYDDVGADESAEIIGVRQVIPGGLPEIVFATSRNDFDTTAFQYMGMCEGSDDPDCEEPGDGEIHDETTVGMAVCSFVRDRWICASGPGEIPADLASLLRCR